MKVKTPGVRDQHGHRVSLISLLAVVLGTLSAGAACASPPRTPPPVLVFAAASLQTAIDTLAPAILADTGVSVRASYAASSALARQIDQGAPADLFISADTDWMDDLERRGGIRVDTRVNLLGNRLVLIAPAGRQPSLAIGPGFLLAEAIGSGRLALADPDVVPAGKYARAALEELGVWSSVASRVAAAENVRAALLLVARGEVPLGIVYNSDAKADARVVLVDVFPRTTHPPIVYPVAVTARAASPDGAARVLAFLQGTTAARVFVEQGFDVPASRKP
jgi:molybdate transport system substrate-binding protein